MRISACSRTRATPWHGTAFSCSSTVSGPRTAEKVIDDILTRRVTAETGRDLHDTPGVLGGVQRYPDKVRDLFESAQETSPRASSVRPTRSSNSCTYYEPIFTKRYDDYNKRRKDLEMFQQITERYRSLGTLPERSHARTGRRERQRTLPPPDADDEKLILSTIHSAKGLEWNTVFVIYALDGRFPATRAAMSEESWKRNVG